MYKTILPLQRANVFQHKQKKKLKLKIQFSLQLATSFVSKIMVTPKAADRPHMLYLLLLLTFSFPLTIL